MMFFLNIFPWKLFIFVWNTMDYFVKVAVASLQKVKCSISLPHDVIENTHCDQNKIGLVFIKNKAAFIHIYCFSSSFRMRGTLPGQGQCLETSRAGVQDYCPGRAWVPKEHYSWCLLGNTLTCAKLGPIYVTWKKKKDGTHFGYALTFQPTEMVCIFMKIIYWHDCCDRIRITNFFYEKVIYRKFESDYKFLLNLAERSSLYMDRLRTIVTEVYKSINGMSPAFLQDSFVIKANVHDLRDNNKMKLYKFKTMIYGKHSIQYVAGILWNSVNVDITNTDNVNVFKTKIRNWQGPICQCACVNCFYCLPYKIKIVLLSYLQSYWSLDVIAHHSRALPFCDDIYDPLWLIWLTFTQTSILIHKMFLTKSMKNLSFTQDPGSRKT